MENLIIPKKFFKAIRKENNKTQILWMRWFFYGEELKNPEIARRFIIDTPNVDPQEIKNIYEWGIKILEDSHFFSQNTDQVQNLEQKVTELEIKMSSVEEKLTEIQNKIENLKPKTRKTSSQNNLQAVSEVISYLNSVMGTEFRPETPKNAQVISARISEGFTIDQLKQVIDKKVAEWRGGRMEKYIRPITLFSSDKFESYVNEPIQTHKNSNQTNLFNYATAINEAKKHFGSGSNE